MDVQQKEALKKKEPEQIPRGNVPLRQNIGLPVSNHVLIIIIIVAMVHVLMQVNQPQKNKQNF